MARSAQTVAVNHLTEEQARMIMRRELQAVVDNLIRAAHKEGARGRPARAEHSFEGALLDAAIRLRGEFRATARACVGSDVWHVSFSYTLMEHAPGVMMIRLR